MKVRPSVKPMCEKCKVIKRHGRVMVIEIMGNKAGWLTLYSGVAGGADVILIPEIPYTIDKVAEVVKRRAERICCKAVAGGGRRGNQERRARSYPARRHTQRV